MKRFISSSTIFFLFILFNGALSSSADTVNYTYDNAGRLAGVDYGDGKRITYTYDSRGNMVQKVVASGETLSPKIKVNFSEGPGPLSISTGAAVSVIVGLSPGNRAGETADVYIGAHVPPDQWFSLIEGVGWQVGVPPYKHGALQGMAWEEILNIPLPPITVFFYFGVDVGGDGSFEGLDFVEVKVQ